MLPSDCCAFQRQILVCRQVCFTGRFESCLIGNDAAPSNGQVTVGCSDCSFSCCDRSAGGKFDLASNHIGSINIKTDLFVNRTGGQAYSICCFGLQITCLNLLRFPAQRSGLHLSIIQIQLTRCR